MPVASGDLVDDANPLVALGVTVAVVAPTVEAHSGKPTRLDDGRQVMWF